MLKNGASIGSIQRLLGHSSITSTQIYTKIYQESIRNAVLKSHPLAKSNVTLDDSGNAS